MNIRPWKQGDRIQPRGMHGSKLVSDVLIDQKWPQYDKENVLVIESEGELCLVIGFREARWASVSGESESCIEITITRSV